jgi:hypothetical protein
LVRVRDELPGWAYRTRTRESVCALHSRIHVTIWPFARLCRPISRACSLSDFSCGGGATSQTNEPCCSPARPPPVDMWQTEFGASAPAPPILHGSRPPCRFVIPVLQGLGTEQDGRIPCWDFRVMRRWSGAWLKSASEPHSGADAFKALPGLIHVSPNKLGYRPSMSHSCYVE